MARSTALVIAAAGLCGLAREARAGEGATVIHVSALEGSDRNQGAADKPVKTLKRAASLAGASKGEGGVIIKAAPGVYNLAETVVLGGSRRFTKEARLTIVASVLPDDPKWRPSMMPVITSTASPRKLASGGRGSKTLGFYVATSHVTIRGLKFLGSPVPCNRYYPIRRDGADMKDLLVSQCVFIGDRNSAPIHVAIIAKGHSFVVDHCIFYHCKIGPLFWSASGGTGNGCAVRYSIMYGSYDAAFWTCRPGEDFEFRNNIAAKSGTFHMRELGTTRKYRFSDCVVVDSKRWEAYCKAGQSVTPIRKSIPREEHNVVKAGKVTLEKDEKQKDYLNKTRNFLHVLPGTLGSDLGAGLFLKAGNAKKSAARAASRQQGTGS
jgi:hypothetical protein